jgi:hypothetical protein
VKYQRGTILKNISKLICFIFLLFIISPPTIDAASSVHSVQALQMLLKTNLKIKADDARKSISYCSDETCEVIQSPTEVSYLELGDFTYLYLFYFSTYKTLEKTSDESEPFRMAGKEYIQEITDRNIGECTEENKNKLAGCILLTLSSKNNIQIYSSRFEKGIENLTPIHLQEILKTDSTEKVTPPKTTPPLTEPQTLKP